ncbi:MAG TPA: penicillin acylase family protein [Opitutaceae bacterium]|nr:penicillin acylase family protein [Opitutaceae bacterium]
MNTAIAKRFSLLASVLSLLVLGAAGAGVWFYFQLRASLPQLDGAATAPGLTAPVTIERDALGVPTVRGRTRANVACALGFVHAQDRFFQMDLLRRHAAGELAELFGQSALAHDKTVRVHQFRSRAGAVLASLAPDERALLAAYTDGVNAGLRALRTKPFEYFVLRTDPQPWKPEDSVLVIYAMTLDLQDAGVYERSLTALRDTYGSKVLGFFAPLPTPDDAALDGSTAPSAPVPPARIIDLRQVALNSPALPTPRDQFAFVGSNAFALSGAHTANGAALLANDMHLAPRVPNTWYRASLVWPCFAKASQGASADPLSTFNPQLSANRITGVTLPGTPVIVAGSNGRIAWGFTNAYADTSDLISIDLAMGTETLYQTKHGLAKIDTREETILVKGSAPVTLDVSWTEWGPIIGQDGSRRPLALRWTAHEPAAANFSLIQLETARTAAEALAIAHRAGIPAQNFIVADADGAIGWTIAGRLPKRVGFDGRLPVSWTFGDRYWDGLLAPDDAPQILAPASGRLWSANQRMIGGDAFAKIGDGGYERPYRAAQIRDDLAALEHAAPRDLLAIELDDRALFLARWQKLLLATLTPEAVTEKSSRAELLRLASQWEGHASTDSVSYRLVRAFRLQVAQLVFAPIFAPCVDADPAFDYTRFNYEVPLWTLLTQKPPHLLNPKFPRWDDLLLSAADAVMDDLHRDGVSPDRATWGSYNLAHIQHPFSRFLPGPLARFLDMPTDPLPGDENMPRVQTLQYSASERFVVSPGHEDEGIFEMPGGQSGHPLSPFYRAGHDAWVHGDPTPFLPGKTEHTLVLKPEKMTKPE